ncbi:MAG: hypothetical protein V1928_05170 [Parcubacteria group bacterium]
MQEENEKLRNALELNKKNFKRMSIITVIAILFIIAAGISLALTMSQPEDQSEKQTIQYFDELQPQISYFKDNRTGICFAYVNAIVVVNHARLLPPIAAVDCKKVERFLENPGATNNPAQLPLRQ